MTVRSKKAELTDPHCGESKVHESLAVRAGSICQVLDNMIFEIVLPFYIWVKEKTTCSSKQVVFSF